MQGFVKSYFTQNTGVANSHAIMNYFAPEKLPVLTLLAKEYALFNGWFSSIPGPTICNRAFAHYGTSFGQVGMNMFYLRDPIPSIYERLVDGGQTGRIYYYDQQSSTMEVINLLQRQPQLFATYADFVAACTNDELPAYSFIEPNYTDHPGPGGGQILASDQHPDHTVQEGERFIAMVYNAIRTNPVWETTALLIVYDEHGGLYDHVVPPACTPDGYTASAADTGTGSCLCVRPARHPRAGDPRVAVRAAGDDRGRSRVAGRHSLRARVHSRYGDETISESVQGPADAARAGRAGFPDALDRRPSERQRLRCLRRVRSR